MDKKKLLHLLSLKSTWVILTAQGGIILKELGILDDIGISKYNVIATSIMVIASVFFIKDVYQTQPLRTQEDEIKELIDKNKINSDT